jgi:hypothetical protein
LKGFYKTERGPYFLSAKDFRFYASGIIKSLMNLNLYWRKFIRACSLYYFPLTLALSLGERVGKVNPEVN